jgi:RimJ/RimL family protein N-acetyltransferase
MLATLPPGLRPAERHTPAVVLNTERLLLRPLGVADIDEFVEMHDHPEVARFIPRLERPAAIERLRHAEGEWSQRGHGIFAVLDRVTGRFLGRAGLKYWPQFDETELGWVLRRDAWGHGYATEAGRACLTWGFSTLTVPYLTAMIHPDNSASIGVARRLDMTPLRDDVLLGSDVVVYAIARDDAGRGGHGG